MCIFKDLHSLCGNYFPGALLLSYCFHNAKMDFNHILGNFEYLQSNLVKYFFSLLLYTIRSNIYIYIYIYINAKYLKCKFNNMYL